MRLVEKVYVYGVPQGAMGIVEIARILEDYIFEPAVESDVKRGPGRPRKTETP